MTSLAVGPATGQNSGPFVLAGSSRQESLRSQSLSYSLDIESADGRHASVRLDYQQLAYRGTYSKFGEVQGMDALQIDQDALASLVGEDLAAQIRSLRGDGAVISQASLQMEQQSLSLSIEGDSELLNNYFAAEPTADRIIDHALGLAKHLDRQGPGFAQALGDIGRGIRQGFADVRKVLGELPQVSLDTESLVEQMLAALREDPNRTPRVADFLVPGTEVS